MMKIRLYHTEPEFLYTDIDAPDNVVNCGVVFYQNKTYKFVSPSFHCPVHCDDCNLPTFIQTPMMILPVLTLVPIDS